MMCAVLRLILAATVGVFVGSTIMLGLGIGDVPAWHLVASSMGAMVLLMLILTARMMTQVNPGAVELESAERENRIALATVRSTLATGSSVNDQPICDVRLIVASSVHAPYETTTRALINLGQLPSMQRGAVVVVVQKRVDRPEVTLVTQPPDAWLARVDADTTVRALRSAPAWELPRERGRDSAGWFHIPAIVLVLVAVLALAGRLYPVRSELGDLLHGAPLAQVQRHADRAAAHSANILATGQADLVIRDLIDVAGGAQFRELTFYTDYAIAEAPTHPGATTSDTFTWRDGTATRDGATAIQPDPDTLAGELFDITTVSTRVVTDLAAQAPTLGGLATTGGAPTSDVADGAALDSGVLVAVRRAVDAACTSPIEYIANAKDAYYSVEVRTDAAGTVLVMDGGAPDSPATRWQTTHP